MKLSSKQAHLLLSVLRDSLIVDLQGVFGIKYDDRRQLYSNIINQQNDELFEVDPEPVKVYGHYRNCGCPACKRLKEKEKP